MYQRIRVNNVGVMLVAAAADVPYLLKMLSISCLEAAEPRLPTYTLQERSHSRYREVLSPLRSILSRMHCNWSAICISKEDIRKES